MRNKSFIIILTMLLVVNAFSVSLLTRQWKRKGNSAKFKTEFSDLHEASWLMKPYQI